MVNGCPEEIEGRLQKESSGSHNFRPASSPELVGGKLLMKIFADVHPHLFGMNCLSFFFD